MNKEHHYDLTLTWTGNTGEGTSSYRSYQRSHTVSIPGKADIRASSDPTFRGDKTLHNPEEFMVAALSACHMLSYLHLCAVNGVVVIGYTDKAHGIMKETEDGSGRFISVTLSPEIVLKDPSMLEKANALHHDANKVCFIANSVNFPVHHQASYRYQDA